MPAPTALLSSSSSSSSSSSLSSLPLLRNPNYNISVSPRSDRRRFDGVLFAFPSRRLGCDVSLRCFASSIATADRIKIQNPIVEMDGDPLAS
ncbi:putative Isocitrate dehydrogenase [NADP] [Cocos nucifera]|uniref:Putative Isocitrate dehydrogenase [NADP] n=1 Tax=Cocos nucifera TaxID=13894 RepID=A0A8K0IS69_COCNU|nr:putative Isocitrate dehydrogenase [NADP] [Cocos nucifera]